jgi:hypothetical protein
MNLTAFVTAATILAITIGGFSRAATDAPETKSCRSHPGLVGPCFTVHGRMGLYEGTPSVRIWRVGSTRILGVSEQRFLVAGVSNIPEALVSQLTPNSWLFGDFDVCPFTESTPGEMQLICVESVTKPVTVTR